MILAETLFSVDSANHVSVSKRREETGERSLSRHPINYQPTAIERFGGDGLMFHKIQRVSRAVFVIFGYEETQVAGWKNPPRLQSNRFFQKIPAFFRG